MTDVVDSGRLRAGLEELADRLVAQADAVIQQQSRHLAAQDLVALARRVVPGACCADLLVRREDGALDTVAATREFPPDLERIRRQTRQGPCYGALEEPDPVLSDQLDSDDRWPDFGQQTTHSTGMRSMLSYRVSLTGRDEARHEGVLSLYSDWPYGFDDTAVAVGKLLAAYCSLAAVPADTAAD